MNDSYIYVITALLPLSALMLLLQTNPYHALVIQGIQGAVATLVFAVLGAADVALTQALMGTLLAITLYAIAVRSSLVMRLGVLEDGASETDDEGYFEQLMNDLRTIFHKHYMRVEVVPYMNRQALHRALMEKEVHAACARREYQNQALLNGEMNCPPSPPTLGGTGIFKAPRIGGLGATKAIASQGFIPLFSNAQNQDSLTSQDEQQPYHTTTRVRRLYDIMQTELSSPATSLTYVNAPDSGEEQK